MDIKETIKNILYKDFARLSIGNSIFKQPITTISRPSGVGGCSLYKINAKEMNYELESYIAYHYIYKHLLNPSCYEFPDDFGEITYLKNLGKQNT